MLAADLVVTNIALAAQTPLSARNPCVWLPYTPIDQLMAALKNTQTNRDVSLPPLAWLPVPVEMLCVDAAAFLLPFQLYMRLADKLADYHKMVEKASRMVLASR